jgi:6-phosphogluconate dehydrogenase
MLPAGAPTEDTIANWASCSQGRHDHRRRQHLLQGRHPPRQGAGEPRASHYVDVGTSGGVWGLERGYCMMIGGDKATVDAARPDLQAALAPGLGDIDRARRARAAIPAPSRAISMPGRCGAGHFVKMVHNGIEYGLMQAYAEGFDILRGAARDALPADERFELDLPTSPKSGGAAA